MVNPFQLAANDERLRIDQQDDDILGRDAGQLNSLGKAQARRASPSGHQPPDRKQLSPAA
jgi:hypothetical protein